MTTIKSNIKTIAKNGQIALGKKFAGKQMQITELANGDLMLKIVVAIPENELWLYQGDNISRIEKSLKWIKNHSVQTDNFEEIMQNMEKMHDKNRRK